MSLLTTAVETDAALTDRVRPRVFVYPAAVWLLLAVCAVLNGAFRELYLIPLVGGYPGHLFSTQLLVFVILVVSGVYFLQTSVDYSRAELVLIGVGWTLATVGFEFLVGYVEGTSVETTLTQYDVLAGSIWILVPIALLVSPLVFGWYPPSR